MGLMCWMFYIIMGIILFFVLSFLDHKYSLRKIDKLVISIIYMMFISGICFKYAINMCDNIFIILIFLLVIDIIYNSYFIERDFFDKEKDNILYYVILILVGFFINQEFINDVTSVFLTGEDLRIILWFLVIIYLYNFFKDKDILMKIEKTNESKMSEDSILISYARLKHKYYEECNYSNKELSNMIYAIMIYNNNKRSKILRKIDYFMFRLNGVNRPLGIMQVNSNKFITDSESIDIVYKKISKLFDNTGSKTGKKKKSDINNVFELYDKNNSVHYKYIYNIISKF